MTASTKEIRKKEREEGVEVKRKKMRLTKCKLER